MKVTNRRIMLTALLTATSFSSVHAMDELAERVAPPPSERREARRELSSDSDDGNTAAPRAAAYDSDEEDLTARREAPASREAEVPAGIFTLTDDASVTFTKRGLETQKETNPLASKIWSVLKEMRGENGYDDVGFDVEVTLPLTNEQLTGEAYFRTIDDAWNTVRWPLTYTLFRDPNAEARFSIQDLLAHKKTDPLAAKLLTVIRKVGNLYAGAVDPTDPLTRLNGIITLEKATQSLVKFVAPMREEEIAEEYRWCIKSQLTAITWPGKYSLFSDHTAETVVVTIPQLLSNITADEPGRIKDPLTKKVVNHAGTVVKRRLTIQPSDAGAGYGGYERAPASMMRRIGNDEVNTDYLRCLNPEGTFTVRVAEAFAATCNDSEPDLSYLDDQVKAAITIPQKALDAIALARTANILHELEITEYPTDKAEAKTLLSRVHGLIATKAESKELELAASQASYATLAIELETLRTEFSAATADRDAAKALVATMQTEHPQAISALRSQLLAQAAAEKAEAARTATAALDLLKRQHADAVAKVTGEWTSKYTTLEATHSALNAANATLTAEHTDLTAKFGAATEALSAFTSASEAYLTATAAARNAFTAAVAAE